MKKIILIAVCLLISPVFAINWVLVQSASGGIVYLDTDSIKEYNGYYFYNIKVDTSMNESTVITMQAQKSYPFSARINYYKPSRYEQLNGDYENITLKMTKNLEPVTYESRAYAAYKKVKQIENDKNKPQITF